VIFLGLLFWPTGSKKDLLTNTTIKKITEPSPGFVMDSPKKINWGVVAIKDYAKSEALLVDQIKIDVNKKIEIRNIISREMNEAGIIFIFDDNRNSFEYSKNITERKQIEKGSLTINEIKVIFLEMMGKLKDLAGMDIKVEEVGNKQFLSPWWVSSKGNNVDATEVLANYYYKDLPIKMFAGNMVKADFLTNGKLAKMEYRLPFGKVAETTTKNLRSLAELKNESPDNYKIWRIDGGADYELSGETPAIDEVKIIDYDLEYIYDLKSSVVWPYYFLRGESELKTGPAKVTLVVSAVKE
jgi:hypothetical protein